MDSYVFADQADVGLELLAQGFDAGVDEEADVADAEGGDAADFLVAESVLKFEADDFLLIFGELFDGADDLAVGFLEFACRRGRGLSTGAIFDLKVGQGFHAALLSLHVQCAVAADGEEPLGQAILHL